MILGSGRSPGKGNGDPLHYSYLENPHGQRSLVGSPWGCKESDMTEAAEGTHMCTHTHTNTHTRLLTDITGGRDSCIRYSTLPSTGNCLLTGHPQGSSRTLLPGVVQGGLTISVSPQPWGPYLGQSRSWGVTGPSADTRLPWDSRCPSCTLWRLLPTLWIPPHLGRQGSLILLAPRSPKALPVKPETATASPLPICPFLGQIFLSFMNYLILFFYSFPTFF